MTEEPYLSVCFNNNDIMETKNVSLSLNLTNGQGRVNKEEIISIKVNNIWLLQRRAILSLVDVSICTISQVALHTSTHTYIIKRCIIRKC